MAETPRRDESIDAGGGSNLGRVTPVQQERRLAGLPVPAQRERLDCRNDVAPFHLERVPDERSQRQLAPVELLPCPLSGNRHLVRDRLSEVELVEVGREPERHPRVVA